jgi:hypothetical protein
MHHANRREFLAGVGRGMLIAGVGYNMAVELGLSPALADEGSDVLSFGALEPLVGLMQETPPDRLLPLVVERLNAGADMRELVAAAALANARAFGGEDYIGFHTFMAMLPAYHMAGELPRERRALPVLKVLYRNSARLQEQGGRKNEVLHALKPAAIAQSQTSADALREAVHRRDVIAAESALAASTARSADDGFNDLLMTVEESPDVHRIVLAYRSYDMLGLVGREQAETMLRQSVRYCVKNEEGSANRPEPRTLLPKLLDQYRLVGKPRGTRQADDAWIDRMSQTIFTATPEGAADAVAAALAEGVTPEAVGEAISVAANQLVLRDSGRREREVQPYKPLGSVHGDSIGVHACDSANAWRNIALVSNQRNQVACLIMAAYQVARDRVERGGDFLEWQPRPYAEQLEAIAALDAPTLMKELDGAIREQNQDRVCALVHRYGVSGFEPRPVFDLLLKYAISEDGALHAEKYYRTVSDEFTHTRPSLRWRQLVALARVTASEYGKPAPGYAQACELLRV